ncbi:hypothetical protein D3C72_1408550 [compost metagenome]
MAPGRAGRLAGLPASRWRGGPGRRRLRAAPGALWFPPAGRPSLCRLRGGILARQIRTDQRHLLCRLRPAHPAIGRGPHHHVPDRAAVRRGLAAIDPAAAHRDARAEPVDQRLPRPARRLDHSATEYRGGRRHAGSDPPGQPDEKSQRRGSGALRPVRRGRRGCSRHARRGRPGGNLHVAPRHHQLPPSAAETGPGHPRHTGFERHRHGTGTDPEPDSECTCGAVHPGGRHGRHAQRYRGMAQPYRRRCGAPGGAQQDRQHVG